MSILEQLQTNPNELKEMVSWLLLLDHVIMLHPGIKSLPLAEQLKRFRGS